MPETEVSETNATDTAAVPNKGTLEDVTGLIGRELARVAAIVEQALMPDDPELRPLLDHVSGYRGKQLRPALVLLVAKALTAAGGRGVTEQHLAVAAIVEMIHTATLVHDDILDGALVRRKLASLNALHGEDVSVLLGDYIYAKAFHMSVSLPDQRCSRLLAEVTRVICQGEITQMMHRFDVELGEDRYFRIIGEKTAMLYGASSELGAIYAGVDDETVQACHDFGYKLGLAFQIIDDCLDIAGDESIVGKSLGTDFESGKLTLPLLRVYDGLDETGRSRFREMFRAGETADRRRILAREFDLSGGLAYAHATADRLLDEALECLAVLPESASLAALRAMTQFVARRQN